MTQGRTRRLKAKFLEAFSKSGVVAYACREAGIHRSLHYGWLDRDKTYGKAFVEADAEFTESLIQEAIRRGRDGVAKPVIHGGKLMGRYLNMNGQEVPAGDPPRKPSSRSKSENTATFC